MTKKIHVNTFENEKDLIAKSWEESLANSLSESKKLLEDLYDNKQEVI